MFGCNKYERKYKEKKVKKKLKLINYFLYTDLNSFHLFFIVGKIK